MPRTARSLRSFPSTVGRQAHRRINLHCRRRLRWKRRMLSSHKKRTTPRGVRTISMGFGGSAIGTRPDDPLAETSSDSNPPDSLRGHKQFEHQHKWPTVYRRKFGVRMGPGCAGGTYMGKGTGSLEGSSSSRFSDSGSMSNSQAYRIICAHRSPCVRG